MLMGDARQCAGVSALADAALAAGPIACAAASIVVNRRRCAIVDGHRCDLGGLLDQVGEGRVHCRMVLGHDDFTRIPSSTL